MERRGGSVRSACPAIYATSLQSYRCYIATIRRTTNNLRFNGEMREELLYDYDDEMLQIELDYFNQFDHLFNDSSGTEYFRFAKSVNNLLLVGKL